MKTSLGKFVIPLAICAAMLAGCGSNTGGEASSSGSAEQEVSTQVRSLNNDNGSGDNAVTAKDEKSIIQSAFGIDINDSSPETEKISDERTQNTYIVDDGTIVIEWTEDEVPNSLYYFKDSDDTAEPEAYSYPDTVVTDAQKFLSDVFGVTVSDTPVGIYGYQNRIGVLLDANDGSCFHVQFMPDSSSVIGCQHFADQEAADTFYTEQNAEKLS